MILMSMDLQGNSDGYLIWRALYLIDKIVKDDPEVPETDDIVILSDEKVDKVPLLNIHQTSVAPNGFPEKAKWRLLEASEEVNESEYVDHMLVEPSESRYRKNYIDLNDKKWWKWNENKTRKNQTYEQKFECQKSNAIS